MDHPVPSSARRNWDASAGAALVAAFQSSGVSRAVFCAQRGIGRWRLAYWERRLSDRIAQTAASDAAADALPPLGFVELRVGGDSTLTVTVGSAQVVVGPGFDAALLRDVVEALS